MSNVYYLNPVEDECLHCMKASADLSQVHATRLDDGTLLITAKQASTQSNVALFVVGEIPSKDTLDELLDWCPDELPGKDGWLYGLACDEDRIGNGEVIGYYRTQPWGLTLHIIPREAIHRREARPQLPTGSSPALAHVLSLVQQAKGSQPNPALDAAIESLEHMIGIIRQEPRALPAGTKVLTISAKAP